MPVTARRLIRKMRGGAQAHLLEASDGNFYVVKFKNNPQHRRILVNEWLAAAFLRFLNISCPEPALVEIHPELLAEQEDIYIQFGGRRLPVEPGWHFGSRFPGDPNRVATYDFVPDSLLTKVENMQEFAGVLVFDKWTGNADARQSIFLRARLKEYSPSLQVHRARVGFLALMIDHGYIFNGPHWEFVDWPAAGLYFRHSVYADVRGLTSFEPWLERVRSFPESVVDEALRSLPPWWLNGDSEAVYQLLERLMRRRARVADALLALRNGSLNPFPCWQS
jgi:hypothetical protein